MIFLNLFHKNLAECLFLALFAFLRFRKTNCQEIR